MCDVGRLPCFLSTAPVLCRVAVRYVDGGRDQSKEKTQGTWFCLFALAGPQRCMVFTNMPDVVGSKKRRSGGMHCQTALYSFHSLPVPLYFPSVGQEVEFCLYLGKISGAGQCILGFRN